MADVKQMLNDDYFTAEQKALFRVHLGEKLMLEQEHVQEIRF